MSTLPTKWAVEITSLQDAERLQALFRNGSCGGKFTIHDLYSEGKARYEEIPIGMSACGIGQYRENQWRYSALDWYKNNGYTIYTITELENLLK